jgi:hypothetical protein
VLDRPVERGSSGDQNESVEVVAVDQAAGDLWVDSGDFEC